MDPRPYRLLLFLFPTNWFWPSSIGKDALMMAALGLACLGVAHLLAGNVRGLAPFAIGAWAAAVIRPHLTLILAVAFGLAMVVRLVQRRTMHDAREVGMMKRLGGLAVVVLCVMLVLPSVESKLKLQSISPDAAEGARSEINRRTSQGGTEYDGYDASTPQGFVLGALTVLFRPLPTDARDVPTLLAAMEMCVLLYVIWRHRQRLVRNLMASFRVPYLAFCVGFVICFCYAFSAIYNLGIISRQRAQVLPILLVLVAAAVPDRGAALSGGRTVRAREPSRRDRRRDPLSSSGR